MTPVFVRINYAVEIHTSTRTYFDILGHFHTSLVSEHHLCKSFSQPFVADSRQIWFESFQKFLKTKIERRYLRTNICAEMNATIHLALWSIHTTGACYQIWLQFWIIWKKAVFQLYSKFMSSLLALRSHELKEYLMGLLFSKKSNRTSIFKWLPSSVFALLSCRRPYQVSTTVLSDCWATFVMYFLSFFLFFFGRRNRIFAICLALVSGTRYEKRMSQTKQSLTIRKI